MVQFSFFVALALSASSALSLTIPVTQDLTERSDNLVARQVPTGTPEKAHPQGPRPRPPSKIPRWHKFLPSGTKIPPRKVGPPAFGPRVMPTPKGFWRKLQFDDMHDEEPEYIGKGKGKAKERRSLDELD